MIKIKNKEAMAFNSPILSKLLSDDTRAFPTRVSFKLMDLINQVQERGRVYRDESKKIIKKFNGEIDSQTGRVTYPNKEDEEASIAAHTELNETDFEILGDRIPVTDDWPRLTLLEAQVLGPLVKQTVES